MTIPRFLGKLDALSDGQAVKPAPGSAVPMRVDLATLMRGDEAVILKEGVYRPVGRAVMDLDVPLPLTEHIFGSVFPALPAAPQLLDFAFCAAPLTISVSSFAWRA